MKRKPVISSNIVSIGYDEAKSVLEIEFLRERVYQYSRVPAIEYKRLMNALSKGTYFAETIRDNPKYGCEQIFPEHKLLRR